jgi:hypothetical protein
MPLLGCQPLVVDVVRMDAHSIEFLGQKMDIDGSLHQLCSIGAAEDLFGWALIRLVVNSRPELVICCLPPHFRKEWM